MPVYKYSCECGYEHKQYLQQDKNEVLLSCLRCGRKITARQVRDSTVTYASNNDVTGIIRREEG